MKNCSNKRCLLGAGGVFVFMFIYETILHHHLLKGLYMQTAALWRPMDEMKHLMPWMLVRYALLALVITCLYGKCRKACVMSGSKSDKPCPYKHGVMFGATIGLFMALVGACCSLHMPIPVELATVWFLGYIVEGVGIGLVLGLLVGSKEDE